jgi:sugar O-acyltransferase (sialic acid O-acetyltransferase NeuD family)
MENPVIIFGAGSLGVTAYDIFKKNGVIVYGFLDDDEKLHNTEIDEVAVLGATDDEGFTQLIGINCEAFIALDSTSERKAIVEILNEQRKAMPVNAIHSTAILSDLAEIGHGNLFGAGAIIGARTTVEHHNVIQVGSIVEADAKIGSYIQIGAGSIIGRGVTVADNVFIGAGVTIVAGVTIGKNARIGAGSVVIESVAGNNTVFGNPAKKV